MKNCSTTSKSILALDGGGIRGIFSLQILARIEALLRKHYRQPDLVLADVFDCFAGTSTGAIIAAGLCWGRSVAEIETLYVEHGAKIFERSAWYRRFHSKYRAESIADLFKSYFCDDDISRTPATFGSSKLRKMLIVVMRNATTGSPWPLCNHPQARYNDRSRRDCNLDIPLWQILRASTAAPSFFPPQEIELGNVLQLFVDGAITPYNNPALLAVLMTTLPTFGVGWPTGRERLRLISVGTGSVRAKLDRKMSKQVNLVDQLGHAIPALIGAVGMQQDMLCRILGECLHGEELDREIGGLTSATLFPTQSQLFTYARYDQRLDNLPSRPLTRAQSRIDNLELIPLLQELGRRHAERVVQLSHLIAASDGQPRAVDDDDKRSR